MIKRILFVILYFLISNSSSFGQGIGFNKSANIYLDNLEKSATPAFYAACKTQDGKAFIIFGLNGKQGIVFDLRGDEVVNSAPIIIKRQTISIDIENTQGGIYTYTLLENRAKDILTLPFKFIMPEKVKEIFKSMPSYTCVDKPPVQ